MAKDERKDTTIRPYSREGEGVIVEVARRMVPLPDGTSSVAVEMELGTAPVPERKYVCNVAGVRYEDEIVYLLFGQRLLGEGAQGDPRLRSLIVMSVSSAGVIMFLKSLDPIRDQMEIVHKSLKQEMSLQEIKEEPAAPQTVALAANLVSFSFAGRESLFDFYYASPYVISQLQKNGKFAVDPIVRVLLPSGLALAIIAKLKNLRTEFPAEELKALSGGSTSETGRTGEVRYEPSRIR